MKSETNGATTSSIPNAAKQMGLDSFTVYGLIQRDKIRTKRQPWGELVVLQIELEEKLEKPSTSATRNKDER